MIIVRPGAGAGRTENRLMTALVAVRRPSLDAAFCGWWPATG